MSQPTPFTRNYDFADFQASNPTTPLPADQVESAFNSIKLTTDEILANLALIQRDDTKLANSTVHPDALNTAVKSMIVSSVFTLRGPWQDSTAYAEGDLVTSNGAAYVAFVAHTSSGSIDSTKFTSLSPPVITPDDPGDDDKFLRATGGVGLWTDFTASMITDVVAAVQAFLTAANLGDARTALGITATGDSLVTAASVANARTALGATSVGDAVFTAVDEAAARTVLEVPHLDGENVFTADQTIRSDEDDAAEGPTLTLDRNSASPLDNDLLGSVVFSGRSDLPTERTMASIVAQVLDVSDTTEDALLALRTMVAGDHQTRATIGQGLVVGSPTDGDKGAGSVNAEAIYIDGSAIGGAMIQSVSTQTGAYSLSTSTIPLDNSIPQNDEGDEFMTLAITPGNASNKLKIEVVFNGSLANAGAAIVALFQDATAGALAVSWHENEIASINRFGIKFTHIMTAGTTSETTFKVRAGSNTGVTVGFNGNNTTQELGGALASSITITEVQS